MDTPFLIGLTGNIGSGKSTVRKMLEQKGARGVDADDLTRVVTARGTPAWNAILAAFGADVLKFNGDLDRQRLATRVFNDPEALRSLEQILHPAIDELIKGIVRQATEPVVVIEAIKLVEAGMHLWCDTLWVVTCTPEVAIARVMRDRNMSEQDARARLLAQGSLTEKLKLAAAVIDNTFDERSTQGQVSVAWERTVHPGAGRPKDEWLSPSREVPVVSRQSPTETIKPIRKGKGPSPSEPKTPPETAAPILPMPIAKAGSTFQPAIERTDSSKPVEETPKPVPPPVLVRRAKRGDLAALGAALAKSENKSSPLSRTEVMERFGQGDFRIALRDAEIIALATWHAENLVATTQEIWAESADAANGAIPSLLSLMEEEAAALRCEVFMAIPDRKTPKFIIDLISAAGYEKKRLDSLHPVWRQVVESLKPAPAAIWVKSLSQTITTSPI